MKMVIQSLLAVWLAMTSAHGAETGIQVRQEGTLLVVEGWLKAAVGNATAWSVLTDYERFPEFVPGILGNRVVEAGNGLKTIEQRGEVVAGQFRMSYTGLMRVEERRGEAVDIQFVSGPFKDVRGQWNIQGGRPLKLVYRMSMDLMKSPFPPPLAPAIAEQQVKTWVEVFGQEMERKAKKP